MFSTIMHLSCFLLVNLFMYLIIKYLCFYKTKTAISKNGVICKKRPFSPYKM